MTDEEVEYTNRTLKIGEGANERDCRKGGKTDISHGIHADTDRHGGRQRQRQRDLKRKLKTR